MGENSNIEWTDHTFNPWVGCQKISPACQNCYAEAFMTRKPRWTNAWGPIGTSERIKTKPSYWKKPLDWNIAAKIENQRSKVFCGSLCDVFEDNPAVNLWRIDLLELIVKTPHLDWLLLTKRPENAEEFFVAMGIIPKNVWLGVTAENEEMARRRVPILQSIPARVRFVSAEPQLEHIDFYPYFFHNQGGGFKNDEGAIHWLIAGCESGPNRRPSNLDWFRSDRDQCKYAGVAFFLKQADIDGKLTKMPELDGQTWGEFPRVDNGGIRS